MSALPYTRTAMFHSVSPRPTVVDFGKAPCELGSGALVPFGVTLGVVVAATGTGDLAGWLAAPVVYSGSAQLAATTLFNHGAGLLTIVASAIAVSARLVLYSASLAPRFHGQPRWFRLIGPHFITDQTYLSAVARP